MGQPHSSFFNFKATHNEWGEDNNFKARLGALESFQSHYHFVATSRDEQEQEYDFTARFNALDELESHYNFLAQAYVYDKQYNFTGFIAPLEMEIENEEEADIVAVIRTANIERVSAAERSRENELEIVDMLVAKASDGKSATIEVTDVAGPQEVEEVRVSSDFLVEVEGTKSVDVEGREEGVLTSEENVSVHESMKLECKGIQSAVTTRSAAAFMQKVESAQVDHAKALDAPIEKNISVSRSEQSTLANDKAAEVHESLAIKKKEEINVELEKDQKIDDAAIPTEVEKDIHAEVHSEESVEVNSYLKGSSDKESSATIENDTQALPRLKVEASIESGKALTVEEVKGAEIEFHKSGEPISEDSTEVEVFYDSEQQRTLKSYVEESGVACQEDERVSSLEDEFKSTKDTRITLELESSRSGDVQTKHYSDIETPLLSQSLESVSANMSQPSKGEINHAYETDIENPEAVERIEDVNANVEEEMQVDEAAMETELEKIILSNALAEHGASVEFANTSKAKGEERVEIERQLAFNISRECDAEIEDGVNGEALDLVGASSVESFGATKSDKEYDASIEEPSTVIITDKSLAIDAEVELPRYAQKKFNDVVAEIEEFVGLNESDEYLGVGIETLIKSDKTSSLDVEIESVINIQRIEERMAEIEYGTHAEKLQEFVTDLEDLLEGEMPEKKRKKLIWLIMGRPSWLHQYWQRTTR